MYYFLSVLGIIICVLLVLIVLVQNSKGGGLAANFASQSQIMGVRQTADFLEKATWTLAGVLIALSILASATIPRNEVDPNKSLIEDKIQNLDPNQAPVIPQNKPVTNNTNKP